MPKTIVDNEKIEINTTEHVRAYLEQLVLGGLYGKNAAEAAEKIITRAIDDHLRRNELRRLDPLPRRVQRPRSAETPPSSEEPETIKPRE